MSLTVRVAFWAPITVDVNLIPITQLAPTASGDAAEQVVPGVNMKSLLFGPVIETLAIVMLAVPVLDTVTKNGGELEPTI